MKEPTGFKQEWKSYKCSALTTSEQIAKDFYRAGMHQAHYELNNFPAGTARNRLQRAIMEAAGE